MVASPCHLFQLRDASGERRMLRSGLAGTTSRERLLGLFVLLFLVAACSGTEQASRELRIALIVPLSGELADVGQVSVEAARMALDEVTAAGGVQLATGRVVPRLAIIDNLDTIEGAVNGVRKAVNTDKVSVIIGGQLSRNAIPMSRVAEDAHVPMISPGSTHPETTAGKTFVFRMPYIDPFQGLVMAKYALETLGTTRAAVLFDKASDYNADLAASFQEGYISLGGQVVAARDYATGQNDFSEAAREIAASGAQVLFLPNYHHEIPAQVNAVRQMGFTGPILGSDSWEMLAGPALSGLDNCFYSTLWTDELATPRSTAFVAAYNARYGHKPQVTAALTYDAFGLLFHALRTQDAADPRDIQKGLRAVTRFEGVTGTYLYSGGGDPRKSAVILGIADGGIRYVGSTDYQ